MELNYWRMEGMIEMILVIFLCDKNKNKVKARIKQGKE